MYWEPISNPDPHQGEDYDVLLGYSLFFSYEGWLTQLR
jgi:hypothetical protein